MHTAYCSTALPFSEGQNGGVITFDARQKLGTRTTVTVLYRKVTFDARQK